MTGISPTIAAHLYFNIQKTTKISKATKTSTSATKLNSPKKIDHKGTKQNTHKRQRQQSATTLSAGPTAGQRSALLIALHNRIQQFQRYPQVAEMLGQVGTARVRFVLFPDGQIADLRLVKTSGYSALDRAALAAVRDASPFPVVRRFIRNAQAFQLDIVFSNA